MSKHRNPRLSVQNKPAPDNFNPGDALERLHTEITQIEAFAHAAGEAVTSLPHPSNREQRRAFNRIYALVTKVADDVSTTVAHGDQLIAALTAHLASRHAAKPERSELDPLSGKR